MIEPSEGVSWVVGFGRWVVRLWHRLTKRSHSQDRLKTREDQKFFRIKALGITWFAIEHGTKHEHSLIKSVPELSIQEKVENKKEPLLKDNEISTGDKKTGKKSKNVASLQKEAKKGDVHAQYNLGLMYYKGEDIEKNYEQAVHWWSEAAEQGHSSSQFKLGLMYRKGENIEKNYKKALQWFDEAATQGNASAQSNLGWMYYKGEGIKKNYKQAAHWWSKAAEQDHSKSQFNLGLMYYSGEGVLENYGQAADWWHRAAERGEVEAQSNLGNMYYIGEGIEQNLSMAYGLYLLAVQGENQKAKNNLLMIKPTLTTEQISEGQKIAREWEQRIEAKKKENQ